MTSEIAQSGMRTYYFNPCTQKYSTERMEKPCVYVTLLATEELSSTKLTEVIQKLGNLMAILSVKHRSSDTKQNYCTDYTLHATTCEQTNWQYCKRHLSNEEIDECNRIEKRLNPLLLKGVYCKMDALNISRGDIELMRRILFCVRNAIQ